MSRYHFKLSEIPSEISVAEFIYQNTDMPIKIPSMKMMKKKMNHSSFCKIPRPDHLFKDQDVLSLCQRLNFKGLAYQNISESLAYQSALLTTTQSRPNCSLDNDFMLPHQLVELPENNSFARFLSSFKRSLLHSRIAILDGDSTEHASNEYQLHRDSSLFFLSRLNIPIISNVNFGIEVHQNAEDKVRFALEPHYVYLYDTEKLHRPYALNNDPTKRINLIISFSPWFDFDPLTQSWNSNEYYGRLHPFDMLENGLIY